LEDTFKAGNSSYVYESYGAAQQSEHHDGEVLCFYTSAFQATVALMHHAAKRLGASLSCPDPKAASRKRRFDATSVIDDYHAGSSCVLVKFELPIANIKAVRALVVIEHIAARLLVVELALHLCVCVCI